MQSKQEDVYNIAGKPLIDSTLEGFNGTILAYGQTSSGKTYTMTGDLKNPKNLGIIPRMVKHLFEYINNANDTIEFTVKVSMVEIYMEKIRDLIEPAKANLKLHEDKVKGIIIDDCTETFVVTEEEVYQLMSTGNENRAIGATDMNDQSSRSHSIVILTVTMNDTQDFSCKTGKLYLVDLAGSEKISKTNSKDQTLNEAKMINKSLSTLGRVIYALTDGTSSHIPYRDSKLTRLLQDSLGGNSKTSLIITASPSVLNTEETLSTCRFGMTAKTITNNAKINKEYTIAELKLLLQKLEMELDKKSKMILLYSNILKEHHIDLPLESIIKLVTEQPKEEDIEDDAISDNTSKYTKLDANKQKQKIKNKQLLLEQGKANDGLEIIINNLTLEREKNAQLIFLKDQLDTKAKEIELLANKLTKKEKEFDMKVKESEKLKAQLNDCLKQMTDLKIASSQTQQIKDEKDERISIIKNKQIMIENQLNSYKDILSKSYQANVKECHEHPIIAKSIFATEEKFKNYNNLPLSPTKEDSKEIIETNNQFDQVIIDSDEKENMEALNYDGDQNNAGMADDSTNTEAAFYGALYNVSINEIEEKAKKEKDRFTFEKMEMLKQMKEHQMRINKLEDELLRSQIQYKNIQTIINDDHDGLKKKSMNLEKQLETLTYLYHQLTCNTSIIKTEKQLLEKKLENKNAQLKECGEQISKMRQQVAEKMSIIEDYKDKYGISEIIEDRRPSISKKLQIKKTIIGGKKVATAAIAQSVQMNNIYPASNTEKKVNIENLEV